MAFLGLRLPAEIGRHLAAVSVPGERVDYGHAHVTITILGDNVPIGTVMQAAAAVATTAQMFAPIRCKTALVTSFPKNDSGRIPVICPVESPALHRFKTAVDRALDLAGIAYSRKFPEFLPHTTLAYADAPIQADMPALEWVSHEVVVWGGDERDVGAVVELPLNPSMAARVAAKHYGSRCTAQ